MIRLVVDNTKKEEKKTDVASEENLPFVCLKRTNKRIPFLMTNIGDPFFFKGKYFIKISGNHACYLTETARFADMYDFTESGEGRGPNMEQCEIVEMVEIV